MPDDSIFQKIVRKVRPGSGGPFKGISIVDTIGGRARGPIKRAIERVETEPDPESTSWPVVLSNLTSRESNPQIPRGYLDGVVPCDCIGACTSNLHGRIPHYEPDDPKVLSRLFGIRGIEDD